jgi:hypothetical protein
MLKISLVSHLHSCVLVPFHRHTNNVVEGALLPLGIFNVIETNVGIVCACLPSMSPLLRVLRGKPAITINGTGPTSRVASTNPWNYLSSQTRKPPDGHSQLESRNESLTWLNEVPRSTSNGGLKTVVKGGETSQVEMENIQYHPPPPNAIFVERNITWTE